MAFLRDLEKEFGQAWFDGARSIVDHRFNNSTERFPLWVLSFWWKLSETVATRNNWQKGCQWLDSEENRARDESTIDAVHAARQILGSLGWNVCLTYLQSTVTSAHLAKILGTMCSDVPARLGPKAPALAQPKPAPASSRAGPSQSRHSRLGPA